MSDLHDDELRRRLRDLPGPGAGRAPGAGGGLDLDAAIAEAKRRRRPKTAALSAAATVAGVLIVAPFVAPSILPSSMDAATMQEGGAGPEMAPAPGAPADEDTAAEEATAPGGTEVGQDAGASGDGGCPAPTFADLDVGLAFLDDPADGVASLRVTLPEGLDQLQVLGVGVAQVAADGSVQSFAAPVDLREGAGFEVVPDGADRADTIEAVPVEQPTSAVCDPGVETRPAPMLVVEGAGFPLLLGEPWSP